MSCGVTKFTITKGVDNTFVFTIKADGTTLPLDIGPSDTFEATLFALGDDSVALTKPLAVTDAPSGKTQLLVTSAEASSLVSDKGAKTDRYYNRPTYRMVIDCKTVNNGNFLAKIPEVYVD